MTNQVDEFVAGIDPALAERMLEVRCVQPG